MQDIRGNLKTYSKQDIAIEYLNLALVEYVKGTNMFAALNLAGAAEEILGKIVRLNGAKSAHDEVVTWISSWYQVAKKAMPKQKDINSFILKAKNGAKHLDGEHDLNIELDLEKEVKETIRKAIENYNQIPGLRVTKEMLAYYQHEKHNE
jgi:hypothetical protein